MFALIKHENIENFSEILNILQLQYDFYQKYITSYFQEAQLKSIINVIPDDNIILRWFHALKNIKNTIPFLRSKNSYEKNISKDLINNIKLMFFIPPKYIKHFYKDIKNEFNSKHLNKFYKYLNKFLFRDIGGKNIFGIIIN